MTKLLKTLLITTLVSMLSLSAFAKNIDTDKSIVKWVGTKITGKHEGTIKVSKGKLKFKKGQISGGKITIDMSTINVTDLEGEYKGKLEDHLKNKDFFDIEKFKTAGLKINSAIEIKGGFAVTADLTIKGITKKVEFNMMVSGSNYTGKLEFDRSQFNVKYNSKSFFDAKALGDKLIHDKVTLDFNISLK